MTTYSVRHSTVYNYEHSMVSSQVLAYLVPRETPTQTVLSCEVYCNPKAIHRMTNIDIFGNLATYLSVEVPHDRFDIWANSSVEVRPATMPAEVPWQAIGELLDTDVTDDGQLARWCRLDSALVMASADLADYARPSFPQAAGLIGGLRNLTQRIFTDFTFDPNATDVSTPLADVLNSRRGVCQDFAHLAVGCLRSLGIPARYVSGYIETEAEPGQPKLIGSDASHAWCSVYLPGSGWVDADPTNDVILPARHVTIAWGRDYSDVAPVRGVSFGPPGSQVLSVGVDVVRTG